MSGGELVDGELTYESWKRALREGALIGQECTDCGHATGAPKAACARCGSRDLEAVELPTTGTVYSETTITVPPRQFTDDTYQVAIIELDTARVMARIDGTAEIGDEVRLQGTLEADDAPAPVFG
ncbi:Zn-ribbon domain-containing OB-fold protein [Haloterrigena alkaliphila]|uniref:Zn-ribbon domain-containing OB-fold protein n=1 Tax=Haloterrigena alkaliphila TaxID=2816475 RepID=UPI001CFFC083|nr:OB-fold domain-containing protein [Haloterrigena alkaliphila]UHQ95187.1 OB-fold domain-containing protein [Haloterrigena alkaliphila]